ncbi:RHS repeat domain-containing protein [Streptomyces sp. NPDC088789]|uniref:RHS repeat domain-containing protein n=1 Tax=Streptomyces sp. NPDC088789 TaxID=3365899 RepID=UPI00380A2126
MSPTAARPTSSTGPAAPCGPQAPPDGAGRLVERVKKRLSRKPDIWRYSWDAEHRLTSCTTPDGTTWHYRYDPLGRRTEKYGLDQAGHAIDAVRFTWDGTRLAEQTTSATGTTLTWEHDGHRPLIQYERKPLPDGITAVHPDADAHTPSSPGCRTAGRGTASRCSGAASNGTARAATNPMGNCGGGTRTAPAPG